MNIESEKRITEWAERSVYHNYTALDVHAIPLLNILVERDYSPILNWDENKWIFEIWGEDYDGLTLIVRSHNTSIAASICEAILKLIESEKQ